MTDAAPPKRKCLCKTPEQGPCPFHTKGVAQSKKTKNSLKNNTATVPQAVQQAVTTLFKLHDSTLQEKCDQYQIDPAREILEVIRRTKDPLPLNAAERATLQMRLSASEGLLQYLYAKKKKTEERVDKELAREKAEEIMKLSDAEIAHATRERMKKLL